MGSSPGFGSAPRHGSPCSDSLPLRLRPCGLNRATRGNSPAHSSIGTPSPGRAGLRLLGGARFQVLAPPSRGTFHRSLTVLCAIGRRRYLALGGGPPGFPPASPCPAVGRHL